MSRARFSRTRSANPADDQLYGAKWLTDVEGSCRIGGYRLAIGAQNLFDVFPDRNSTVNSFNGIETFPRHSPFGMNGRSLYARVGWKF
jgi:iron complex outermembrane receptor protein